MLMLVSCKEKYSPFVHRKYNSVRGKALDFVDLLIANKSHFVAESRRTSLSALYSFDKAVEQLKGAKKP